MKYLYLLIDLATISVPLIFSFHPKINFYKHYKAIALAVLIPSVPFLAWDILFTAKGVWGFNSRYITTIYLFNLPLEEVLFFICIPYACLFTYFCLTNFFHLNWPLLWQKRICTGLALMLIVVGGIYWNKLYTSSTFIGTGVLLLLHVYFLKSRWIGGLISVYLVLLVPFCLVNGILTGTGLEQPVVWYNNSENLGVRLGTIPMEDIFYGFEFVLLNVSLFNSFRKIEAY